MTVYITKDKFGLKFKTEANSNGWTYFSDNVNDAAGISKYFEQGSHQLVGGKYNPPTLDFRNEKFEPVVCFTVSNDRKYAFENFDPGKKILIDSRGLATDLEVHDFLRPRCPFALEEELVKLDTLEEKTALLLKEASAQALIDLHKHLATDTAIQDFLGNHAKKYSNSEAIIEFTE